MYWCPMGRRCGQKKGEKKKKKKRKKNLKSREIFVCPVKLSFYCVHRNLRETRKWCVFQKKTWVSNDIFFFMPLGIVGDFILH